MNISLGTSPLAGCPSFDSNGDNAVTVNEVIQGVDAEPWSPEHSRLVGTLGAPGVS